MNNESYGMELADQIMVGQAINTVLQAERKRRARRARTEDCVLAGLVLAALSGLVGCV